MSNEYKEWLQEQTRETLLEDNLRVKLKLQQAYAENIKIKNKLYAKEREVLALSKMVDSLELYCKRLEEY